MKRDRPALRRMIRKSGLGQYEEQLMQTVRPSIRVVTKHVENENDIPIGQSKIGGRPDLSQHIEWPTASPSSYEPHPSLSFLAQFNLKDIKPFDEENLLPQQGMLYFFVGITEHKVIFLDDLSSSLERRNFPDDIPLKNPHDDWSERYEPCRVKFVPELNLERIKIDEKTSTKRKILRDLFRSIFPSNYNDPQTELVYWLLVR